ncbi:ankyrin repeat-containing domain protein [Podospora aff. communis PSN243]|uniref:Ankyrin repeat-containing domain protein n=1 Tax=Podospora aff. communis PSN243 TaxID=3040156 RepID=A0AAV9G354_9PEZI|nr:ankyrin repeat-containing domain protein [Podospora aff. communis PSN243]
MSFGFSPSDIINVATYCWQLVEKSKNAPSEFGEISRNVEGLHSMLLTLQAEADNSESLLHRDETAAVRLSNAVRAVRDHVLPKLEAVLQKFPSLGIEKPKLLERMRFPKNEVLEIRTLLAFNNQIISSHLEALQTGALGRVEHLGTIQSDAIRRIEASLDQALPKILGFIDVFGAEARVSANPSEVLSDDDAEIWAALNERLQRIGFKSATLERHETVILGRIQELREEGLLSSDAPSESEGESLPRPTSRYVAPYYETESESDASSILSPRKGAKKKWTPALSSPKEVDSDSTSDADSEGTITPTSTTPSSRPRIKRSSSDRTDSSRKSNNEQQQAPQRPNLERRSSSSSSESTSPGIFRAACCHFAAENGFLAHVQFCLTTGSHIGSCGALASSKKDPSKKDDPEDTGEPKTALCIAVDKGHFEIAKFLLESGANVDSASLYHPVVHNQIEMARLLVEYGAEIGGWIHVASSMGYAGLRDLFLDYGANVNAQDDQGYTPLFLAAWQGKEPRRADCKASGQGHEAVVENLLEHGDRPNDGRGAAGETALFKATARGSVEIVQQLLAARADPNIPNSAASRGARSRSKIPCQFLQAAHGQMPDLRSLVGKYDGKLRNQTPQYPLHQAAINPAQGAKIARILLDAGARVDVKDSKGIRPIEYAVEAGFGSMADLLESRGSRRPRTERDDAAKPKDGMEALITEAAGYFMGRFGRS